MSYPAKTWRDAFNAFDPTASLDAGDPRYVELSPGRGNQGGLVPRSLRKIRSAENPIALLVAGHIGSGKTTELQRLGQALEGEGFWVADLSLEQDLDIQDPEIIDILLAIARQLERQLREKGVRLEPALLSRIESWFSEVIKEEEGFRQLSAELETEAQAGGKFFFLASLLARFTSQVRTGTTSKNLIRKTFEPKIGQLHSNVRDLIREARSQLRLEGKIDLVMIIDALDRIPYYLRANEERSRQEIIFIERGELLKDLGCHLVYTVPISLIYSERHKHLESIFPHRFVVPMVKIQGRTGEKQAGWERLRELLHRRLDKSWLTTEAEDRVIAASGGNPRQLIALVQAALDFVEEGKEQLSVDAASKAIHQLSDGFGRSIGPGDWERLAEVSVSKMVADNDAEHRAMLFNLSIFEYQNDERWCDVNPLILGLSQFQKALRDRKERSTYGDVAAKPKGRSRKSS